MKSKRKYLASFIAVALLLGAVQPAFAAEVEEDKWSGWDGVLYLYPGSDFLAFTMATTTFPGGTCNGGRQFYIDVDDPNYEVKAKVVTAVFLAGKDLRMVWDGDDRSSGCFGHVDRFQAR